MSQIYHGVGASPGITIGKAWVYRPVEVIVVRIEACNPEEELLRLEASLAEAKDQISALEKRAFDSIGKEEAAIFEAHLMFLEDPEFIGSIKGLIQEQRINAEAAVEGSVERFAEQMLALDSEYFQARAQDIRDVGMRIIYCLAGVGGQSIELPEEPVIIFADDLTPSDTMQFDRRTILGLCTVRGGPTSHTAILARSLGVPAIVSAPFDLNKIDNEKLAILDGSKGDLVIDPDEGALSDAQEKSEAWQSTWRVQLAAADKPAVTLDGQCVEVVANIGNLEDAHQAVAYGAEGVGLLRTEFLYINRQSMPGEEEQVRAYRQIFEVMGKRPLVIRTLDIGGDKAVQYLGQGEEPNPFLGWRAIRMVSERPDLLRVQLRALLRAGKDMDLRIMIPLVSCVEEVRKARLLLDEAKEKLSNEGELIASDIQFGIMVEVPSAALLIEHIAELVDFFSIGTNDLTQYTLAVDRTNERVAALASPYHPAVLKLIARTIEKAHERGKWVGLCGEMAGDPLATPLLLGLGLDEFSMAPISIPVVKEIIRKLEVRRCREIARGALEMPTTQAVINHLQKNSSNRQSVHQNQ